MLNACGNDASVSYATPVVEDPAAGMFHAVVPGGDTLRLTADGAALDLEEGALHTVTDLRVESEAVTATLPRARSRSHRFHPHYYPAPPAVGRTSRR